MELGQSWVVEGTLHLGQVHCWDAEVGGDPQGVRLELGLSGPDFGSACGVWEH